MSRSLQTLVALCFCVATSLSAAEPPAGLIKELAVLEPLVGKSFRGEFAESTKDKPMIDAQVWERALNGQAVRMLHSINDGVYGGETIFIWDAEQKKITYWYFTTAGFNTHGTLEVSGKGWSTIEEVKGNSPSGITKVKATSLFSDDGTYQVKSEYFVGDKWTPGNERTYKPAKDVQVKFK